MSNYLPNFNNLYANLSQSAYPDGPNLFAFDELPKEKQDDLSSGKSIDINYSQTTIHTYGKNGDKTHTTQGLSKGGIVYLQPEEQKRIVA